MYNTNSKRKSMIFSKKKNFWYFRFFSKGGTLWCQNRQKIFFPFFKNFKNKTQKWLSWDHSNINRNKVRNFGGRSSYPAETARPFTVVRAIMAPPPVQNRVNLRNFVVHLQELIKQVWCKDGNTERHEILRNYVYCVLEYQIKITDYKFDKSFSPFFVFS